jgi:hypothetical protein
MRKFLLLIFSPLALSCNHTADKATLPPPTDHSVYEDDSATENIKIKNDTSYITYIVDTTDLSPAPGTPIKILLEGSFHKSEIWRGAEKKEWLGLFYKNKQYSLEKTSLQIIPTFDPVLDSDRVEKGSRTISGREVVGASPNVLFFINGLDRVKEGPVDSAIFKKVVLPVNKSLTYSFKGSNYNIRAYGDSIKLPSNEYVYQSYGWKVSGQKKGKKVEQVLSEDQFFEDSIYVLLWAGDLDRDGVPDLLLDLSNHYNVSRIALFLSSKAEKGKLYKKVALFETVGG